MIGSEPETLIDHIVSEQAPKRWGGPMVILSLVLAVWVTARAVLWESPFAVPSLIDQAADILANAQSEMPHGVAPMPFADLEQPRVRANVELTPRPFDEYEVPARVFSGAMQTGSGFSARSMRESRGHRALWRAALTSDFRATSWHTRKSQFEGSSQRQAPVPVFPGSPPFVDKDSKPQQGSTADRWSLAAWAFFREGSGSAPIAQGRVPVYGASQIGANLQYRVAPLSKPDPRLYLRAYRALIEQSENEIAAGVSVKPVPRVPVRVAAELRATDNQFRSEVRPAVYAITEIPPVNLPLGISAEIYAGAGYVAGDAETGFIDGQTTLTRELTAFDLRKANDVRVSFGAGAWGGAQRDANRLDMGPTMRIDVSLGAVPARLSIDYRERVGGDAAPVSGLAATVSTQF